MDNKSNYELTCILLDKHKVFELLQELALMRYSEGSVENDDIVILIKNYEKYINSEIKRIDNRKQNKSKIRDIVNELLELENPSKCNIDVILETHKDNLNEYKLLLIMFSYQAITYMKTAEEVKGIRTTISSINYITLDACYELNMSSRIRIYDGIINVDHIIKRPT